MSNILSQYNEYEQAKREASTAEQALRLIHKYGFTPCVAGGYVRDTYYGVKPRDMDIIIVGHIEGVTDEAFDSLYRALSNLTSFHDKTAEEVEYNDDVEVGRLSRVLCFYDSIRDMSVDLIFYNAKYIYDCLGQFDYNINTAHYPSTMPFPSPYHDARPYEPVIGGTVHWMFGARLSPDAVVQMKDDLPDTRKLHILTKAKGFGFDVDEQLDALKRATDELDSFDF